MFSMPFAHKGKRRVAVADVGSGSAAAAILTLEHGKPARIEAAHRSVLPFEERAEDAAIAAVAAALSESLEKVHTAAPGAVESAHVLVRAPWVRSKTIRALKKFPAEEKVRAEMIAELAKEALAGDKELDHAKLIEAAVVRVELNGYPTASPEGKRAHSLFVSALASECDSRIQSAVKDSFGKRFASAPIFHSGTKALLTLLRERSTAHTNLLVIHMGSAATSIVNVHKGMAVGHALVREGTGTLLKNIAGQGLPEEALSLMRMLARDHCEDAACEGVKAGMARAEQDLLRVFGEAFNTLAASRRLPETLVLAVEPGMAEWLGQFFSRIDFTQFTVTNQVFSVEQLSIEELRGSAASPNPAAASDFGLLLAAGFVNRELAGH